MFASTPDQEEMIEDLVQTFYQEIFPLYFSDQDISEFKRQKVLHTTTRHYEYFGTLKEAYQVITSLQTLISILESSKPEPYHEVLFENNVQTLKDFGLCFPFSYCQFIDGKNDQSEVISAYSKAANELLV